MTPAPPQAVRDLIVRRLAGSFAASFLLAVALVFQASAAPLTSAVVDEPAHLTAGYLALAGGDLRVNKEHPPLMKELAALPLLFMNPALPARKPGGPEPGTEDFEFEYSRRFLYQANDAGRFLRAARTPVMILTLLLGAFVYIWGRTLAGAGPALIALAFYVLEPNILGHGRLVTTDLGAAAFSVATLWTLRLVSRRGSTTAAIACGFFLGCALLTKFSTLLLLPIGGLLLLLDRAFLPRPAPGDRGAVPPPAIGRLLNLAGVVLFTAWVILLAGYRFSGFPLPGLYVEGLQLARLKNATVEGPSYLMGRIAPGGFWSYYLIALLVKTPLPLLALAASGLAASLGGKERRREALWVFLPAAGWILSMTLLTRAQIGFRYILPVTPLLCLGAGLGAKALLDRAKGRGRRALAAAGLAILLVWQAAGTIRVHPYHLAYFNEIAGGPAGGWRWLVDSNLDWGQDLIGLERWLARAGNPEVNLYYFGTADPDRTTIRRRPYGAPAPGLYAVSATHLAGVYLPDPDYLGAFREMEPVARVGYSIFVYRTDDVPARLLEPAGKIR